MICFLFAIWLYKTLEFKLMHDSFATINFPKIFETLPGSYAVMLPDMTYAAVNDEYLRATMRKREDLIGRVFYKVFADNPEDAAHSLELKTSFEKVFRTGEPDRLPDIKYDVERPPEVGGGYEERYWSAVNLPCFNEQGEVIYLLNCVENITGRMKAEKDLELKDVRVLVVDDEADTRALLTSIFESCKAEIVSVASVSETLKVLENGKFDVLVSDIGMPNTNGYELIKSVRQLPTDKNGRIPAVALTAYARAEDRMRALSAGFQMHIPKPIEPAELITIIASLTSWNKNRNR